MKKYKKNGYEWTVIHDDGRKAIAQHEGHYEVFYWQHNPEREIAGVTIPSSITPPGNEQWGTKGWTFTNLIKAVKKWESL